MGCERETVLKILVKIQRDLWEQLRDYPECRRKALERIEIYKTELEDLLAQEPTFSR